MSFSRFPRVSGFSIGVHFKIKHNMEKCGRTHTFLLWSNKASILQSEMHKMDKDLLLLLLVLLVLVLLVLLPVVALASAGRTIKLFGKPCIRNH